MCPIPVRRATALLDSRTTNPIQDGTRSTKIENYCYGCQTLWISYILTGCGEADDDDIQDNDRGDQLKACLDQFLFLRPTTTVYANPLTGYNQVQDAHRQYVRPVSFIEHSPGPCWSRAFRSPSDLLRFSNSHEV
jgi:hypothetical protein